MRILCSVVQSLVLAMLNAGHHLSLHRTVAGKFVGNHDTGRPHLPLQQLAQQTLGGLFARKISLDRSWLCQADRNALTLLEGFHHRRRDVSCEQGLKGRSAGLRSQVLVSVAALSFTVATIQARCCGDNLIGRSLRGCALGSAHRIRRD